MNISKLCALISLVACSAMAQETQEVFPTQETPLMKFFDVSNERAINDLQIPKSDVDRYLAQVVEAFKQSRGDLARNHVHELVVTVDVLAIPAAPAKCKKDYTQCVQMNILIEHDNAGNVDAVDYFKEQMSKIADIKVNNNKSKETAKFVIKFKIEIIPGTAT